LINIEKETLKQFYNKSSQKIYQTEFIRSKLLPKDNNLDLLVSASFDDYNETLRFLNAVILFFPDPSYAGCHFLFTIPAGLNRLEFEIERSAITNA